MVENTEAGQEIVQEQIELESERMKPVRKGSRTFFKEDLVPEEQKEPQQQ
jgi:hypothetical protein